MKSDTAPIKKEAPTIEAPIQRVEPQQTNYAPIPVSAPVGQ